MSETSAPEATQIAKQAYAYLYPLVTMDITRRIATNVAPGVRPGAGPMNTWSHHRTFPPADFKEVVRPNFDTLYSIAWLDLTTEPVVITVPDSEGRYYMLPILDMWTDVVSAPGRRTTGTGPGRFAITGPGWTGKLPDGIKPIAAPTPYAWVIGRTQTNGAEDYAEVHRFQDGLGLGLLSDWDDEAPPTPPFTFDPSVDMETPPLEQVNAMSAEAFFAYGLALLQLHPPHPSDGSMVLQMQRIGLDAGAPDLANLDAQIRSSLAQGAGESLEEIRSFMARRAAPRNGWLVLPAGPIGVYGNEYLFRAVVSMMGLGANPIDDALYPVNVSDADGDPTVGERRYTMHFAADMLPPVGAFWSVTMYDHEGFPVPNPIDRCAIGDRDDLTFNADGSLDIYIQHEPPGTGKEANWLPSPAEGRLGLTMRLYEPKPAALSGEWSPPPLVKVG